MQMTDALKTARETRRILLDGSAVDVTAEGDMLRLPDGRTIPAGAATHLPPCEPTKVICVHLNFMSRVDELRTTCPPAPSYFHKPVSCLNGHRGDVVRPRGCKYLNYEGEVGIVIGRRTRNIRMNEAPDYIEGHVLANDFGLHDFRDTDRGSMLRVKGADTLGAVGPGLVRGWDFRGKRLRTLVNGRVVQEGMMDELIWSMNYLVADLARCLTLEPGDLILSGTPSNSRPVQPGDIVRVEVDGLGVLENRIVESAQPVSDECGAPPTDSDKVRGVALGEELRE
jgi:5-oxopent-3-ene-1,2,5-tricarboxylate decarboxylase / 2-hydroxyhepta-2,4-diene-1,7-dioate isomerase